MSNESAETGVSYQVLGVVVFMIAAAITWIGVQLHQIHGGLGTTVVGAVLLVLGLALVCFGLVARGRARR